MKFIKIVFVAIIVAMYSLPAHTETLSCASATDTQFVPSWGQVSVNKDQYSKYIYQWMYWSSSSRTSWFNQNLGSTFEPDAFFGGPTGETPYGYLPRNVWYGSGDVAGYWNSDLPTPYQDTAWSDTGNEWAVTVGSAQASLIQSGHVYYTVTRMLDGGVSTGKVKLSAQRGVRGNAPGGVDYYGKWNSYGCAEQPNNIFTLPWGANFTAPGCRTYWYKWDISTNQAC